MDMDGEQQFSLHQGVKRLTMSARDISQDRLVAIFQVVPDTLYLEDDITGETFFPDQRGHFGTVRMRDRGSFAVLGTFKEHVLASSSSTTPSSSSTPTQPCRPWMSSVTHPTKPQNPTPRAKSVRRPIYVSEVDDFGKVSECITPCVITKASPCQTHLRQEALSFGKWLPGNSMLFEQKTWPKPSLEGLTLPSNGRGSIQETMKCWRACKV
ncbi:uncharacterized protein LOC121698934 [Alosa sapidissima]|uniref:uncharacterized protein LOC121698934 n=1 Tax=Alosa sapidissima TaxID=34773 RepID=UPI001C087D8D|nr:uncharacterized protein LOC121684430 isoform X2 [Alosa sapidissima]XP_041937398.1 uncharacterized protein LOC121698934 [Alosa sapidissima]